jgi:Acetyltransferase (GNAT) domain
MVYEIDPLTDPRWSEFLSGNPQASVFHTRGWLEAVRRTYGHRPAALTTSGPNAKLTNGLVFCRVRSWVTGPRLVSLPFSDHCELLGVSEDRRQLLSGFEELASSEGCRYVEIRPPSPFRTGSQSDWQMSQAFYLHRLDLRPGADGVFHNFHRDCIQRRIRHAEKQGLEVTEGRDPDSVRNFYSLVLQTRRRHGLPPQSIAWFRNLIDCLAEAATIRCATKEGRPVAAILTLQHGKSLYYKYGASAAKFHKLGAMPYLFWHAIQDAISRNLEELDMGRSECENLGLVTFKERWAATRSVLSYLRFPADAPRRLCTSRWGRNLTRGACRYAPEKCLTAIGALSYHHID